MPTELIKIHAIKTKTSGQDKKQII